VLLPLRSYFVEGCALSWKGRKEKLRKDHIIALDKGNLVFIIFGGGYLRWPGPGLFLRRVKMRREIQNSLISSQILSLFPEQSSLVAVIIVSSSFFVC
jgi:hypothetical protein